MTAAPPWLRLLDWIATPVAPADRAELLWADEADLARLSSGERAIVRAALALRAVYFDAGQVDRTWQLRLAAALRATADAVEDGGVW